MVRIQPRCAKWERGKAAIGIRSVSLKCFYLGFFLRGAAAAAALAFSLSKQTESVSDGSSGR